MLFVGFAVAEGHRPAERPLGRRRRRQRRARRHRPHQRSGIQARHRCSRSAGAGRKKRPKPGSKKYEELKEAALGELIDSGLDPGRGRRTRHHGDRQTDRNRTRPDQENELPDARRLQGIPRNLELHPGRRQRKGRTAAARQENPGTRSPTTTPPPSNAEIPTTTKPTRRPQYTTKAEPRRPADHQRRQSAKSKRRKEASKPTTRPPAGKRSRRNTRPTRPPKPKAACRRDDRRTPADRRAAEKGDLRRRHRRSHRAGQVPEKLRHLRSRETQPGESQDPGRSPGSDQLPAEPNRRQQEYFSEFVAGFQSKWASRTTCASRLRDRTVRQLPVGDRHRERARTVKSCYEANPKTPATECPAPVEQNKPAIPGSVTVLKPAGEQLVQRPQPEAAAEERQRSRRGTARRRRPRRRPEQPANRPLAAVAVG